MDEDTTQDVTIAWIILYVPSDGSDAEFSLPFWDKQDAITAAKRASESDPDGEVKVVQYVAKKVVWSTELSYGI